MKVFAVELFNHRLRIWILRVPLELSGAGPPEPVLHYIVNWDFEVAVLLGDAEDLLLRGVFVLALPEAVGPFTE